MMKSRKYTAVLLVATIIAALLLSLVSAVRAATTTDAEYTATLRVTDNNTAAINAFVPFSLSSSSLINNNHVVANFTDTAIVSNSGADVAYMPAFGDNVSWLVYVPAIGANTTADYTMYLGGGTDMAAPISYFPGPGGMTVPDDASLEMGDNFTHTISDAFIDTTQVGDNITDKPGAIRTYISGSGNITAEILNSVANPTVEATSGNETAGALVDPYVAELPAGVTSGDLLILILTIHTDRTITFPAGWVNLYDSVNTIENGAWYKIADGTEGDNVSIDFDSTARAAHIGYRISGYSEVPEVGTAVTGSSAQPDPPIVTPSWGSLPNLYIAVAGANRNTTGYPAGYGSGIDEGSGTNPWATSANKSATSASDDPGIFQLSASATWATNTIVVKPLIPTVTASGVSSGEYTISVLANPLLWATGNVLHFDGTSNSDVNAGSSYNNTDLWVSFWFRPDSNIAAGSGEISLWGKQLNASNTIWLIIRDASGSLEARLTTSTVQRHSLLSSETSWTANTWYHVLYSINPARLIINNGTPVTDADTTNLTFAGGDFLIGNSDATATGFTGYIANFVAGTDNLTTDEELALYNNNAPGDETDFWYIDEGSGTNIISYGSLATAGTANSANTWATQSRPSKFALSLDGIVQDSVIHSATVGVPDNSDNWTFFSGAGVGYAGPTEITVSGTQAGYWDWEYAATFTDSSGNGNTATPTFRTTTSHAQVSAVIVSFDPVDLAEATDWSYGSYGTMVSGNLTEPSDMYSELVVAHIPGDEIITDAFAESSTPIAVFWFTLPFFLAIVLGLVVYQKSHSLFAQWGVMMLILVGFASMGPVPLWPVFFLGISGVGLMVARQTGTW